MAINSKNSYPFSDSLKYLLCISDFCIKHINGTKKVIIKNKSLPLLIASISFSTNIISQSKNYQKIEKDLKPFYVEAKKGKSYNPDSFGKIYLIDGRIDSTDLGTTYINLKEGLLKIVFEEKTSDYLTQKLNDKIKAPSDNDTILIILRSLKFKASAVPTGGLENLFISPQRTQSTLLYGFDIYFKDSEKYKYIGKVDSLISSLGWIPSNTTKLLTTFLDETLKKVDYICNSYKLNTNQFSYVKLEDELDFRKIYPVLYIKDFKNGIYNKYSDFLGVSPDTTITFSVIEDTLFSEISRFKLSSDIDTDSIWGFAYNNNTYMRFDSAFYQLERSENSYNLTLPYYYTTGTSAKEKAFAVIGNLIPSKGFIFLPFVIEPLFRKGEKKVTYYIKCKIDIRSSNIL